MRLPCWYAFIRYFIANACVSAICKGRAMERLAENRKGPSSLEHKKRQMLGALATSLQVLHPLTCSS